MAYFPNFRSRRLSKFIDRFLSWIYPFGGAGMAPLSSLPDGVFRHALRPCRKLRFSNRWSNPRKALLACKHGGAPLLSDGVFRHALRSCRKLRFSNRWPIPAVRRLPCKHGAAAHRESSAVLDYYVGIIIPGGFICQIFCVEFCVTKLRRNCMHRIPKKHRQPAPHLRGTRPPSMSPIIN